MIPVTTFAGKTVAVFGLGGSGIATARALIAGGATVAAWDDGEASRDAATKAGIPLVDLDAADWSTFAALVLAPGVPLTHPVPHWTVPKAIAAQIEIIGDIELFCRERNKLSGSVSAEDAHAPNAPFIAITGTNGKSTTTSLIAHILREAGMDVQMGGNIGVPILALEPPALDRFHVIEMSSFQIDLTPSLNPTVGVLLNITPDHLDRHGTLENYAAVKERLVVASQCALVGIDDDYCVDIGRKIADAIEPDTYPISAREGLDWGYFACGDQIVSKGYNQSASEAEILGSTAGVATLRGRHNLQNAVAACAACWHLGVPAEKIATALRTYPGLAHRMEEIGRIGPILLINDSKATNADSTEKALLSFPQDVYWILGGKPKDGGIESLVPLFPHVAKAYLIGAATEEFAATLEGHVPYARCGVLEIAVAKAIADATRDAGLPSPRPLRGEGQGEGRPRVEGEGRQQSPVSDAARQPIVLLSPACASYDQYKSFEHRGDAFRALVTALPGFTPRSKA